MYFLLLALFILLALWTEDPFEKPGTGREPKKLPGYGCEWFCRVLENPMYAYTLGTSETIGEYESGLAELIESGLRNVLNEFPLTSTDSDVRAQLDLRVLQAHYSLNGFVVRERPCHACSEARPTSRESNRCELDNVARTQIEHIESLIDRDNRAA